MSFTIGQLASRAEISVETVRYYERCGLINRPAKPSCGYRKYGNDILRRLQFIRKAKSLGFKLDEIRNLLMLNEDHCEDAQMIAQNKLEQVRQKLADLHRLEGALDNLIKKCAERKDKTNCPIIETLLKSS
jgi:MerR family mercuric resistance operon transcriptional regulator